MARGPRRQVWEYGHWRGENNREAPTEEIFSQGYLTKLRNYHLLGRGVAQKRKGHQLHVADRINAGNTVQSQTMYEFGTTRHLVGVSGGRLGYLNGSSWDNITGLLTLASGQDDRFRWAQFLDGNTSYLVGTDNKNRPFKWDGTSAVATLLGQGSEGGPSKALDITEFFGRLWAINTDTGETVTEYSEDGEASLWPGGLFFSATRESPGVALTKHNDGVLLLFHQNSIHRVEPNYDFGEFFARYLVDDSVGCKATHSVVTYKGVTYFYGPDGFYKIQDPRRPAEYISWPIETYINELGRTRDIQVAGFARGEPWNEVVWLVSHGARTVHDSAIVYNPVLDAWTIFEAAGADMDFNCGTDFLNSDGKHITILGTYDGHTQEAWGDDSYDTGNLDGGLTGAAVRTEFETGFQSWGYAGLKRTREIWFDMKVLDRKTFTLTLSGVADSPATSANYTIGTTGAVLGSFILGTDALSGSNPDQVRIQKKVKARLIRLNLTESDEGSPQTLHQFKVLWVPRGLRIKDRT